MGTYVTYTDLSVRIKKSHVDDFRMAVATGLFPEERQMEYKWVDGPGGPFDYDSIEGIMEDWGFIMEEDGDFLVIDRCENDKIGDEEELFYIIAPFVENGGVIELFLETGDHYKYHFNNGEMTTHRAELTWVEID